MDSGFEVIVFEVKKLLGWLKFGELELGGLGFVFKSGLGLCSLLFWVGIKVCLGWLWG